MTFDFYSGDLLMKKLGIKLATTAALLLLSSSAWSGCWYDMCAEPYVGVDAQIRHMDFKRRYGHDLLNESSPQGNIYAGLMLNNYLAIEGGFETTINKTHKSSVFPGSQAVFGVADLDDSDSLISYQSRLKMHGVYANLLGFYPICDEYRLQIFALVGIVQQKITIDSQAILNGVFESDDTGRFSKRKTMARAGLGLQHMISKCSGVRFSAIWENTSQFKNISTTFDEVTFTARVKDSVIYSIGVFHKF